MGILDSLFTGTAPTTGSTSVGQTQMPAWYQDLMRGVAAQGVNAAAAPRPIFPGQQTAGFTPDQIQAMSQVRSNQGSWAPLMTGAQSTLQSAQAAPGQANAAVAAPAQTFPQNYQQYMSPYTASVVDEIGRLGQRNLNENLLPAVNDQFIGAGGFGSTRNAEIFGRTVRDANADILGRQAGALESGYGTAANIFGADANRTQNQGQLQAQTALAGGNLGVTAGGALGSLGGLQQGLQTNDTNALGATGALQQSLEQTKLNNQYKDFQDSNNYDFSQLGKLTDLMKGVQMPTTTSSATTSGGTPGSPSALQWLSYIGALGQTKPVPPQP